jgi:hypothetical protein
MRRIAALIHRILADRQPRTLRIPPAHRFGVSCRTVTRCADGRLRIIEHVRPRWTCGRGRCC